MADLKSDPKNTSVGAKSLSDDKDKDKMKTVSVLDDYIKHPLENTWALWFFKNARTKKWADNLRLIIKFNTIEDFWAIYNNIRCSSELSQGCDYNIFKDGIPPMWESDDNKNGGKWQLQMEKRQHATDIDRCWLETIMFIIGENFEDSGQVNGATVQIRSRGDRLAMWLKDCKNDDAVMTIGNMFKEKLKVGRSARLQFYSHEDAQATNAGSLPNMMFSL